MASAFKICPDFEKSDDQIHFLNFYFRGTSCVDDLLIKSKSLEGSKALNLFSKSFMQEKYLFIQGSSRFCILLFSVRKQCNNFYQSFLTVSQIQRGWLIYLSSSDTTSHIFLLTFGKSLRNDPRQRKNFPQFGSWQPKMETC